MQHTLLLIAPQADPSHPCPAGFKKARREVSILERFPSQTAQECEPCKGHVCTDLEKCIPCDKKNLFEQTHCRSPFYWLAPIAWIFPGSNQKGLCFAFSISVSSDPAKFPIFHSVTQLMVCVPLAYIPESLASFVSGVVSEILGRWLTGCCSCPLAAAICCSKSKC